MSSYDLSAAVTPNAQISRRDHLILAVFWAMWTLILWQVLDIPFLPKPGAILASFETLRAQGTFLEFWPSLVTMAQALFFTVTISLSLAYLSVVPLFRPFVSFLAGLRYLGLVGLMLLFTLLAPSGHALKVMVLTFGMSTFYLRDLRHVVTDIAQERYDHARTLGMGPWRTLYEVVIRGTLADAIESLRVNAAMGWMMLTSVETVVQSEGGIGRELYLNNKHMDLAAIGAILIALFCLGLAQDFMIGFVKDYIVCPYARLAKGR